MERTSQNTIIAAVGKELKRAFADECTKRGKSMTQIVRQMTIDYINQTRPKHLKIQTRLSVTKEDSRATTRRAKDSSFGCARTHQIC